MNHDWKTRARAALIHLGASALVAALAAALVFGLWYPWPYSVLAGGIGLFVLLTSVDVVMGPCITAVIFDRRKPRPELRRDLAVVVVLQLLALSYGLHTLFEARPVALALEGERFRVVRAIDVQTAELAQAPESLRSLSLSGPRLLRAELPTDAQQKFEAVQLALQGADLGTRPKFWRPWDAAARAEALAAARPLAPLQARYPQRRAEFDDAIARTGRDAAALRYLPLLSSRGDGVVLVDARNGEVAGFALFSAY